MEIKLINCHIIDALDPEPRWNAAIHVENGGE
jgi:hypothetical protein